AAGYNLLKKIEVQKAIEELQQQKMASAMGISSLGRTVKPVELTSTEDNIAPSKSSNGTVAVAPLKNIPRPDQNSTHRGTFERNKKKIYATQSVCGICGRHVDFSLKYPHPLSACIDHIIPVAKGGHPSDIENLQLAHWTCNRTKSDKLLNNKVTPTGETEIINNRVLPQSVDWRTF
uniref:HNH endonuclease signature motif containing protein n=1 Tax=Mogibacterium timidum TaxID=35519 RepID=UPI00248CC6E5